MDNVYELIAKLLCLETKDEYTIAQRAYDKLHENNDHIEKLETELDNEREASLFWQAKARTHKEDA